MNLRERLAWSLLPALLGAGGLLLLLYGTGADRVMEGWVLSRAFQHRRPSTGQRVKVVALRSDGSGRHRSSLGDLLPLLEGLSALPEGRRPEAIAVDILFFGPNRAVSVPELSRLMAAQQALGTVVQAYAFDPHSPEKEVQRLGLSPGQASRFIAPFGLPPSVSGLHLAADLHVAHPDLADALYGGVGGLGFVNRDPAEARGGLGPFALPLAIAWTPPLGDLPEGVGPAAYPSLALATASIALCGPGGVKACLRVEEGVLRLGTQGTPGLSLPALLPLNHRPQAWTRRGSSPLRDFPESRMLRLLPREGRWSLEGGGGCWWLPGEAEPISMDSDTERGAKCREDPDLSRVALVVVDARERQEGSSVLGEGIPGAVHAQAIEDLLSGELLRPMPPRWGWIIGLLLGGLVPWIREAALRLRGGGVGSAPFRQVLAWTPAPEVLMGAFWILACYGGLEVASLWPVAVAPALAPLGAWGGWQLAFRLRLQRQADAAETLHRTKLAMATENEALSRTIAELKTHAKEVAEERARGASEEGRAAEDAFEALQGVLEGLGQALGADAIDMKRLPTESGISALPVPESLRQSTAEVRRRVVNRAEQMEALKAQVRRIEADPLAQREAQTRSQQRQEDAARQIEASALESLRRTSAAELQESDEDRAEGKAAVEALRDHGMVLTNPRDARAILQRINRIHRFGFTARIQGETGTGKQLIARAIHTMGPRAGKTMVPVNCATLQGELADAALFGHPKGAFTGAAEARPGHFRAAEGGTLFLDEIHTLSLGVQERLLCALQERQVTPVGTSAPIPFDVQIIIGTNQDLPALVARGRLLPDFFHRLSGTEIYLKPLRERPEDIGPLATLFLDSLFVGRDDPPDISPGAVEVMGRWRWPGNIRQLEGFIEQAGAQALERAPTGAPAGITREDVEALATSPQFESCRLGFVSRTSQVEGAEGDARVPGPARADLAVFGKDLARRLPVYRRGHFVWSQIDCEPVGKGEDCPRSKVTFYSDAKRARVLAIVAGRGDPEATLTYLCRGLQSAVIRQEQRERTQALWAKLMDLGEALPWAPIRGEPTAPEREGLLSQLQGEMGVQLGARAAVELVLQTWSGRLPDPRAPTPTPSPQVGP